MIVVHITEGTFPGDLNYLANPAPGGDPTKAVSCHVYMRHDGVLYKMVAFNDVAWTQGLDSESERTNRPDLWSKYGYGNPNEYCLSIEMEAEHGHPVTDKQLAELPQVLADMITQYPLTADGSDGIACNREHIVGHYEINNQKSDPTQPFPWDMVMAATRELLAPGAPASRTYENGHTVQGGFLSFFDNNGGLPVFGLPLTEEEAHPTEPGVTRQVFEKAEFEYSPAWPDGQRVKLGAIGRLYLQAIGH